jgi:hypothetical protein
VGNYFFEVRPNLQFRDQLNRLQSNDYRDAVYSQQLIRQQSLVLGRTIEDSLRQLIPRPGTSGEPARAAGFMDTGDFFRSDIAGPRRDMVRRPGISTGFRGTY